MSEARVAELEAELKLRDDRIDHFKSALKKLHTKGLNASKAVDKAQQYLRERNEVQQQLGQAQQTLQAEQKRRTMAEQAAAAAKASAQAAEQQAARSASAAQAAQADAAAVRQQLQDVQAQLARLQAACDSTALSVRQQAQQQGQQQQNMLRVPSDAALELQVHQLAAEMHRMKSALGGLAQLAVGDSAGHGAAPPLAPLPAAPAARPTSPQKQRRGRKAAGAGRGAAGPASPRGGHAAQGPPSGAAAAAAPQLPVEAARDRAVREMNARRAEAAVDEAAAAATAVAAQPGAGGPKPPGAAKRGRPAAAAAAAGPRAAAANVFAEALGNMEAGRPAAKRAKQAQQAAAPRAAAPPPAPTPAAPAEASLAVSANARPEGGREHPAAADEAAQLLGRITSAAGPDGPGISLEAVRTLAADLHFRLAEGRLPLLLLVRCFETAVLDCAAPAPQGHYLHAHAERAAGAAADEGPQQGAAPACIPAAAAPASWFAAPLAGRPGSRAGAAQEAVEEQQQGPMAPAAGAGPPFAAVWCKREALAGHHLPWLLHCASEIQRLHSIRAAAAAALAASVSEDGEEEQGGGGGDGGGGGGGGDTFAVALQRHLHREMLSWCLAASGSKGRGVEAGMGGGARVRHTETEACAMAAAAAALCRMLGDAEAFWALLLDLVTCPAAPAVVLPPVAAALDVWPEAVAAAAGGGGDKTDPALQSRFHAALQHLCAQTEAAAAQAHVAGASPEGQHGSACSATAGDGMPPLLLEQQPAAAAVFLRRLGQCCWGWEEGAEGEEQAAEDLLAAASSVAGAAGGDEAGRDAQAAQGLPAANGAAPAASAALHLDAQDGDAAVHDQDVEVEEI